MLAKAVAPYVAQFAHAAQDSGLTYGREVTPFTSGQQFSDLFSVLDHNPESARVINAAAHQQYQHLLDNITGPGPDGNQATVAGHIRDAMIDGAADSFQPPPADPGADIGKDIANKLIGQVPYLDKVIDIAEFANRINNLPDPAETTAIQQAIAETATSHVDLQVSLLNTLLDNNPDLALGETLGKHVQGGQFELPATGRPDVESALDDFFDPGGPAAAYGVDESDIVEGVFVKGPDDSW